VIFYHGFALENEEHFFEPYFYGDEYTVAGFSYGAIKAAYYAAHASHRIDTLQLFSPAFFQTKSESFRKLQMGGYVRNPQMYIERFKESCFAPYFPKNIEMAQHNEQELHELLYFTWTHELIELIRSKGIVIEVFLGLDDCVIDVLGAKDFFLPFATVTSIRLGNHFLQEC
jgi:hypothetical protein